jgi:hypothetical protein
MLQCLPYLRGKVVSSLLLDGGAPNGSCLKVTLGPKWNAMQCKKVNDVQQRQDKSVIQYDS